MRLYYNLGDGKRILVADVMTNHSVSIDDILSLVGIDMSDWAEEQGWARDEWDFGDLELEA